MHLTRMDSTQCGPLATVFEQAFTTAEGEAEGRLIAGLVERLLATTPEPELAVFAAMDEGQPVASILFTQMKYDAPRHVVLLSPVAVGPSCQGKGVGSALIRFGLAAMHADGADTALTYGDPAYYGRLGFQPITQQDAPAPYPLGQPEGWLGQSLGADAFRPLSGIPRCAPAFRDAALW